MARPRLVDDSDLLDRIASGSAFRSGSWSLQEAAREAGVHPATLIKRFGSRSGVLLALSRLWIERIPSSPVSNDPQAELRAWVDSSMAPQAPTDARAGIAMLIEDLRNPELRLLLEQGWQRELSYLEALLTIVLRPTAPDPPSVARLLLDLANGMRLHNAASSAEPTDTRPTIQTQLDVWTYHSSSSADRGSAAFP